MVDDMIVEWMQMEEPFPATGAARLLCVDGTDYVPQELLEGVVQDGIEVMSVTDNLDDALRQAFMGFPDIIVLPYVGDQVLAFLRAIDYMRSASFSPYVVLVADDDHGAVLDKCDGFYRVTVVPRNRAPQQLRPHLRRIAREVRPNG